MQEPGLAWLGRLATRRVGVGQTRYRAGVPGWDDVPTYLRCLSAKSTGWRLVMESRCTILISRLDCSMYLGTIESRREECCCWLRLLVEQELSLQTRTSQEEEEEAEEEED